MALIEVNESNFEREVLNSSEPVLVDFYATWCMPCKMMMPVVDELAGTIKVCKINVDEAQSIARNYGVASIPTFVAFKNGEETDRIIGMSDKESLSALL